MICFKCFNSDKVIASNSLIKIVSFFNFFYENINDFLDAVAVVIMALSVHFVQARTGRKHLTFDLESNCA